MPPSCIRALQASALETDKDLAKFEEEMARGSQVCRYTTRHHGFAWQGRSGVAKSAAIISGIMSFVEKLGGKTRAAMDAKYNVWRELMVENIEKCRANAKI